MSKMLKSPPTLNLDASVGRVELQPEVLDGTVGQRVNLGLGGRLCFVLGGLRRIVRVGFGVFESSRRLSVSVRRRATGGTLGAIFCNCDNALLQLCQSQIVCATAEHHVLGEVDWGGEFSAINIIHSILRVRTSQNHVVVVGLNPRRCDAVLRVLLQCSLVAGIWSVGDVGSVNEVSAKTDSDSSRKTNSEASRISAKCI